LAGFFAQNPNTRNPPVATTNGKNMVGNRSSASAIPLLCCFALFFNCLSANTYV
jgi:hypothetical protein